MTAARLDRRNFLRGRRSKAPDEPRPPWAITNFADVCSRCGDCLKACPEHILRPGDGGFPCIDFSQGGCTFCQLCVSACEPRALDPTWGSPWTWRALVDDSCLAGQGVYCRACGDYCDAHAIRFRLQIGGRALPDIDPSLCTGCGACQAPCPTGSIRME